MNLGEDGETLKSTQSRTALFLVLVLIASLLHFPVQAAPGAQLPLQATETLHSAYFKVLQDTEIVDRDSDTPLGVLKKGTYFRHMGHDGEHLYLQWADTVAYIPLADVAILSAEEADNVDDLEIEWTDLSDHEPAGHFSVKADVDIRDTLTGDLVAVFYEGTTYSYIDQNERTYRIVLGNRLIVIEKSEHLGEHEAPGENEAIDDVINETIDHEQEIDEQENNSLQEYHHGNNNVEQFNDHADQSFAETIGIWSFTQHDLFFEVVEDNVAVYDNSSGSLVKIGELVKGEVYPRLRDYGNWHEIQFGDRKGYVRKKETRPADGRVLKDLNNGRFSPLGRSFVTLQDVVVYDNKAADSLTPFAVIQKGERFPILTDYGSWWRIDVAGRIGYVRKSETGLTFTRNDRFFEVVKDNVPVYDNSSGSLVKVGELVKGEVYPRLRDYGNWHEIQFGKGKAYVRKRDTQPVLRHNLRNINTNQTPSSVQFRVLQSAPVYDNTSGRLVKFAQLERGQTYPIISNYGAWWRIDVAGRIGYIHKSHTEVIVKPVVNPRQTYTYEQMQKDIRALAIMYPDIIETRVIGRSVDGRNLYAVKLGTGTTEVMINASHHAREHMTTNLVMKMLDEYAYAYHTGRQIDGFNVKTVLDRTSIWFVPMVNPDGVTLVQKGHKSAKNPGRVLALNNNSTNFSAWKANIRGVDLNRQYPALWNTISNDPGRPGPANYKGPNPLSEPESRALYNFTLSRDFKTAISYHSSGEVIFTRLDVEPFTRPLANQVAAKTGYQIINLRHSLSGGGFTDWFILNQRKPALTPEISPPVGPRPVPLSNWDRIWRQNHSVGLIVAHEAYQNRNKR
ncbi:hypothetical protein GCM10010965_27730 [Caldalkalibacillus thermarum]|uniref:M14 family metallocarboxypeptidase n=1 Tax=Caldalkalibacillus thermarum TaxID=296745 RepID=UPI001662CD0F|nr:M14 family metallocarboxypeptidase [Caldalkalibacillus thermarum]GGK33333.1 hypothetical protein GCM10010965_27730 [Caldalkalibacillus thermarum]